MTPLSPPAGLKKTPLLSAHQKANARMLAFGGWWLPVHYRSILEEHRAVRTAAGMFDISHMGEVLIQGPEASTWLNTILTNDLDKLSPGQGQYTFLLNEQGGVLDDLIVYRTHEETYFLVINAACIEKDVAWMKNLLPTSGVELVDASDSYSAIALQGPLARDILAMMLDSPTTSLPRRNQLRSFLWRELELTIARTGYTGEDGFEIFASPEIIERVWGSLLNHGTVIGLLPCGLGARDTLRLEACFPLNGNDLSPKRTPIEADLGRFVSITKLSHFPGKSICLQQRQQGIDQKLIAFRLIEKGAPPRPHYPLFAEGKPIGEVTSGTLSPTLGYGIGLGYVSIDYALPGRQLEMKVRGADVAVEVTTKPFYQRKKP